MRFLRLCFIFIFIISYNSYAENSYGLFKEAKDLRAEGKNSKAIKMFEKALSQAEKDKNIQLQMNCHIELAELKDNVINYKEALDHYKSFSLLYKKQMHDKTKVLEDSVSGLKNEVEETMVQIEEKNNTIEEKENAIDSLTTEQLAAQLAIMDLELDNQKKKLEIEESENRRNMLILALGSIVLVLVLIGLGYLQKRNTNKQLRGKNRQIVEEKEKSENLLLNILPKTVAEELKEYGKTTSSKFDKAAVMFTDFKGFTQYAEKNSPEDVVAMLDHYFSAFDRIMEKYNIEKIKTIGDAYLCVSGINDHNQNYVSDMIHAAFEMQKFMDETLVEQKKKGGSFLQMRVGIHCGPLVAGVVGSRKFAYDIWGDTVNIAARMEQSGEAGGINISETVYELVKDDFEMTYRGEVEAKNKGKMKMYFVNKLKVKEEILDELEVG